MKKSFFLLTLFLLLLTLSCGGGGGGGSSSGGGGSSAVNYRELYNYNASSLDGHTIRWETPIRVYTNGISVAQNAVSRWGLPFTFTDTRISSPVTNAISMGYSTSLPSNTLGRTIYYYYTSGKMYMAAIYLNANSTTVRERLADVITHEAGHAIGFLNHTSDGGLMDATSAGSSEITSTVRNTISLLYSLPIGTDIRPQIGLKSRLGGRYRPNGTETISGEIE